MIQIRELLEHNDFLTTQSQKIREFYIHMAKEYPLLAFNFKGRIKSLIRSEAKFNGYIVEYIYDCYTEHKAFPSISDLKQRLSCFRDLIAYRIVISLPKCCLLYTSLILYKAASDSRMKVCCLEAVLFDFKKEKEKA